MANHEDLVEQAKTAINAVHTDTSVDKSETLASLKEINEELEILIDAVESDVSEEEAADLDEDDFDDDED